jgi:DegV family protein with EDD domain
MTSKILVVTDSSAVVPQDALQGLNVPVIPLWVIWDNDRLRDGVDIDQPTFYRRLQESEGLPTTSQPSAGEFEQFFQQVSEGYDAIVSILVTSKLSGTVASALVGREKLRNLDIRVVDSLSTSMGMGFIVLAAARAAAAGASIDEVVSVAEDMRDRTHLLFTVDTLEYLHRGGRIGSAKWLMGSVLSIKPLLHLDEGTVNPLAQVRTKRRALERMLEVAEERLGGRTMAEAAVIDADSPEEGNSVAEQVREQFGITTVYRTPLSPAIGTHAGPGTVGLAFYAKT